jgi:hypothetical protein
MNANRHELHEFTRTALLATKGGKGKSQPRNTRIDTEKVLTTDDADGTDLLTTNEHEYYT